MCVGSKHNNASTIMTVLGTITEQHTNEVAEVFGKEIAEKLQNCEGKTFLEILMNSGKI
jgi:hypothetical protein